MALRYGQQGPRQGRPARKGVWQCARARDLASGVCRDTILCIVIGGAGLASQHNAPRATIRFPAPCDTAGPDAATREAARVTRRTTWLLSRDTVCIVTREGCDTACQRAATWQDMPATRPEGGPRHGPAWATTRRCVRGLGATCAQLGPWVCALCTRPSFLLSALF